MNLMLKGLIGYAVATSLIAHAVGVTVLVFRPDLVTKVRQHVVAKVVKPPAVAAIDVNEILPAWQPLPPAGAAPNGIWLSGRPMANLAEASGAMRDGDTLTLGPGVFRKGMVIKANNVMIEGRGSVTFSGGAVQGKGVFVVNGDGVTLRNLRCENARVRDGNGACVRLQGQNLTLEHVYFHDSQQGLLTGRHPGKVIIENSRFERLGHAGQAHGIYVGGGELEIRNSVFLASQGQGHEIKSRARSTLIENTIIASLDGPDSRLVDVPDGGDLIIRNSVLEEGPASVNSDIIGYGLEANRHGVGRVELTDNLILVDSWRPIRLWHAPVSTAAPLAHGNVVVGRDEPVFAGVNFWLKDRAEAQMEEYPALPPAPSH